MGCQRCAFHDPFRRSRMALLGCSDGDLREVDGGKRVWSPVSPARWGPGIQPVLSNVSIIVLRRGSTWRHLIYSSAGQRRVGCEDVCIHKIRILMSLGLYAMRLESLRTAHLARCSAQGVREQRMKPKGKKLECSSTEEVGAERRIARLVATRRWSCNECFWV